MRQILNRILYSFYGFERWIDNTLYSLFGRVGYWCTKIMYEWNPGGYVKKYNKSFEEYKARVDFAFREADRNLDYGLSISHAQGFLSVLLGPYMMLAVSLVKYFVPVNIPNTSFKVFVLVCLGVSYLIAYLLAFKDDVYKAYFKKFKKEKKNLKWHILTLFVCLGSLYSVYLSIVYWNK